MTSVESIMQSKGREVWTVTPKEPVVDALKILDTKNIGALVVVQGDAVIGIVSERDFARKLLLKSSLIHEMTVGAIMTSPVITVSPEKSIDHCMELMTSKRIRHLPVVENNKLVGLISIGDVVKAVIAEKEFLIRQLENYITGRR
jgi:CBS domain-containing protein